LGLGEKFGSVFADDDHFFNGDNAPLRNFEPGLQSRDHAFLDRLEGLSCVGDGEEDSQLAPLGLLGPQPGPGCDQNRGGKSR